MVLGPLAVMGENLALNVESRGYSVAVYNRTTSKVDEFIAGRAKGKNFVGCHSLEEFVGASSGAAQGDADGQGRGRRSTRHRAA
jgi:6-phosphogluconate dehydrogenase